MKIYNKFIIAGAALLIASCGETFLDSEPITKKTDVNYYKTPADAAEALVGCYDALQYIYSDGTAVPVAAEVMADMCFGGTGAGDGDGYPMLDEFDYTRSPGDKNIFEANWRHFYRGIYRVNMLISKLDQVDWGKNPEKRNEIEAEARFLRAYFYFDMARLWERVPLLTEPSSEVVPQATADAVYAVITDDLLFAVQNGISKKYSEIATTDYGHATRWSAIGLLARVYLFYTGYYGETDLLGKITKDQVLAHVEDLIDNSGHDLVPDFASLWPAAATYKAAKAGLPIADATYAGENNQEIVFGIKYTYLSDYNGNLDGNHWMVMNGLRGHGHNAYGYGAGWGACTVVPGVYTGWDAADQRREASVMAIAEEGVTYSAADISDVKEYTGYFTKKYIPTYDAEGNSPVTTYGGVNFMIGQFQDYFAIRFADVLLMAAELGSSKALTYVNRVRLRAGVPEVAAVDKDVIYEERRLELAFEGIRYWDLLRYDASLNYAAQKIAFSCSAADNLVSTGGFAIDKVIDGNKLKETRGLSQIPYNQITLSNNVYTQNTGW